MNFCERKRNGVVCGLKMVALFHTPQCEVCELGGPDTPTFFVVFCSRLQHMEKRGSTYCGVFEIKAAADAWAAHCNETRGGGFGTYKATYAKCSVGALKFDTGGADCEAPLVGTRFTDAGIYKTEAFAERNYEQSAVRLVLVGP